MLPSTSAALEPDQPDWGMQCGMWQPREQQLACCDQKAEKCKEACVVELDAAACPQRCDEKRTLCRAAFGDPLDPLEPRPVDPLDPLDPLAPPDPDQPE